jgi:hypothetical protein
MLSKINKLGFDEINALARGDILAIQIEGFVPRDMASKIGDNILGHGFDRYLNAPSIGRIGMAFYEAESKPPLMAAYFESAFENMGELRRRCQPYPSPIDLLRCSLDESWPAGAQLETLYGKKMYAGLSRVVTPGVTFLAHHDIFEKDAPDSFRAQSLGAQMAANVYLTMPESGGALQLWSNELSAREFDRMRGDSYGIDPTLLGEPDLEVCPQPGDLIIFNSRLMHSVTPGTEGLRLSVSCFVGYRGPASALTIWS